MIPCACSRDFEGCGNRRVRVGPWRAVYLQGQEAGERGRDYVGDRSQADGYSYVASQICV